MITYFECDKCGQIEADSDWAKAEEKIKCKHCDAIGRNELWPSAEIRGLFEYVSQFNQSSPEYGLVTSVFVSSALELLLERLIYTVAVEDLLYDEVGHLIELLLDTNQGRARRLQLYKHLAYASFEEEAYETGCGQFMKHWNEIAEIRNKSLHGDLKESQTIAPSLIETTISESLRVFSMLHNKYNSESLRYGVARGSVEDRARDLRQLRIWKEGIDRTINNGN
jgi:hypothetical protein